MNIWELGQGFIKPIVNVLHKMLLSSSHEKLHDVKGGL